MPSKEQRFICLIDPCDAWAVWDQLVDQPAEKSVPLVGLDETGALKACRLLNSVELIQGNLSSRRRLGRQID